MSTGKETREKGKERVIPTERKRKGGERGRAGEKKKY